MLGQTMNERHASLGAAISPVCSPGLSWEVYALAAIGGVGGWFIAGLLGAGIGTLAGGAGGWFATRPGPDVYIDSNCVRWSIVEEMPDFWSASTEGYGGKFTHVLGYISRAQAEENIEGNAKMRDPKTGEFTAGGVDALYASAGV